MVLLRPRVLLALAVLAGLALVPGPAGADPQTMSVYPNTVFTGGPADVEVVTAGATSTPSLTLTVSAGDADPFTGTLLPAGPGGTRWSGPLLLARDDGAPADTGLYDAALTDPAGREVESCTACLTVVTRSAPGATGATPLSEPRVEPGTDQDVTVHGTSFTEGTVVDVLLGPARDPLVQVGAPDATAQGPDSLTRLTRSLTVAPTAVPGFRSVRFTNGDGRTSTCLDCLTVTVPLEAVSPNGATNDLAKRLLLTGPLIPKTARPRLTWVGVGAPARALDLVGKRGTATATSMEAVLDLTGAAPGLNAYEAGYVLPDGSVHGCRGTCRFSVRQADPPTVTGIAKAVQAPGTTTDVTVTGTGFGRGAAVSLGTGTDLVVLSTTWVSTTQVKARVQAASDAADGTYDVTVTNTDGAEATLLDGYTVAGPPSAPAPAPRVACGEAPVEEEHAELGPTTPLLHLARAQSPPHASVLVTGTADPGSTVDLFACTRPDALFRLVRTSLVPSSGRWSFDVAPSRNTRLFASSTTPYGRASGAPVLLTVRSDVAVHASHTAARTWSFSGTVTPARRGQRVVLFAALPGGRRRELASTTTTATGTYVLRRAFPPGRLDVYAGTGADLLNGAGRSGTQRLLVR